MNEAAWRRLIAQIAGGLVVPVVGPQLMVGEDGQSSRQADLARLLRERYGLDPAPPLPRFRELNAVVGELKARQVNLQDVYGDVDEIIQQLASAPGTVVPRAIRQLAEIADFRLFVTLTPDDLLARCLRQRVAVNEIVHSPYLPSSENGDLPTDWQQRPNEVQLLYLFGKARSAPMFAIHDEDVLEYAHNIIARGSHARECFVSELRHRNLLLLGSNFPDWLGRFFLRTANPLRLMSDNKPKRDWLIEGQPADDSLTLFLRSFSRDTEVLAEMPPREFVAELHRRWMAERGAAPQVGGEPDRNEPAAAQGALFFVSYCRDTDAGAAQAFVTYMREELGVAEREIWFDRHTIEPADRFARTIFDGIRSCRYFVPLISRPADAIAEKFFRREWRAALEREAGIMGETFVLPQIVDAEYRPQRYQRVPREWCDNLDFGHAPAGTPDERTAKLLRRLVRSARLALTEAA